MSASILRIDQPSLSSFLQHCCCCAEAAPGHRSHPLLWQCCPSRKALTTTAGFPLQPRSHIKHPPSHAHLPVNMANIADAWLASYIAALAPESPATPTPPTCPSSQDAKWKNHHGAKSCFYLFSFPQTQQNNQATLLKQKKDPFPPRETQQAPFLGTFSTIGAAQLSSAPLQRRACDLFAFWAGGHQLFPSTWLPSKVPALHSTFLQKAARQGPETPSAHDVYLHQAPPAASPQPLSTNYPHIHFLVCSH